MYTDTSDVCTDKYNGILLNLFLGYPTGVVIN